MMNESQDKMIADIMDRVLSFDPVAAEDIPHIPLYMDQVTTFMESVLAGSRRYDSDKIMTKTMINNYAKNKLLPAPEKKKYSEDHMILLFFIYYMKNVLSISDISTLLRPITDKYFQSDDKYSMADIYREIFAITDDRKESIVRELDQLKEQASKTFSENNEEEEEFLQLFSYIALLCYDVYLKKQIVEGLVDHLAEIEARNND